MEGVSGYVLAGGRSERMGAEKALMDWNGRTLLSRAVDLAHTVATEVRIVGPREKFGKFGPVVEDVYSGRGPLAGIHAALASTATELNLVLAVDTPFVEQKFLEYLVGQAHDSTALVTLPRTSTGWQPLCAIYRPGFAPVAEAALRAGRNKIDALYSKVEVRVIDEAELRNLGFEPAMFDNLNTREEFDQAHARRVRSA